MEYSFYGGRKGADGKSFDSFRVIEAIEEVIYPQGMEEAKADDIDNKRKIFVYDVIDSNSTSIKVYYIGDYNIITNIVLAEDGELSFDFTHEDKLTMEQRIRWIKNITREDDNEHGIIKIIYNTGEEQFFPIRMLSEIYINTDIAYDKPQGPHGEGEGDQYVTVKYTDDDNIYKIGHPMNYVMDMTIHENHLLVYYSDPERRRNSEYPNTVKGKTGWTDLGITYPKEESPISETVPSVFYGEYTLANKEKFNTYAPGSMWFVLK